jgi:hypothetical protein
MIVENTGDTRLDDYWVDVEFPKLVSDAPLSTTPYTGEQRDRETKTHRFFRLTEKDIGRTLYPGDRQLIFDFEYHMDEDLEDDMHLQGEEVKVTVSAPGMKSYYISKPISELHEF